GLFLHQHREQRGSGLRGYLDAFQLKTSTARLPLTRRRFGRHHSPARGSVPR
ncbi:hypothetical protein NDU88_006472, partial [Pleurodeles waltl]